MAGMARETLLDFFADITRQDDLFIVHDDGYRVRKLAYPELGVAAPEVADRLTIAGLRPGDHLVIWAENRPEWLIALWGALLARIVVVPVDFRASAELVARIADVVDAKLVLTGSEVGTLQTTRPQALLEDYATWDVASGARTRSAGAPTRFPAGTRTPAPRHPGTPEP